jgi:hypothetical protein
MEMNMMKVKNDTSDPVIIIEDLSAEYPEAIQGGRSGDDKRQDYLTITLEDVLVS